jgi:hypothetical protein
LNPASRVSRQKAISFGLGGLRAPGFSSTKAQGTSPHLSSGLATTAHLAPESGLTAGWCISAPSTSTELTFSPPEMMMSLARSVILMAPSGCWKGDVARMEPAALERLGRGLGVAVVALHHGCRGS